MIFDLPTLVSWVSQAMTLEPGDLLLTGTPEGVGPLAHGQLLELELGELPRLSVRVAKEA
jgi:acylpyruvate hydrolase